MITVSCSDTVIAASNEVDSLSAEVVVNFFLEIHKNQTDK